MRSFLPFRRQPPPLIAIATDAAGLDRLVDRKIGKDDNMMPTNDPERYFAVGRSAISLIAKCLLLHGAATPERILDFGCGFGRVARYLRAAFPDADITAADASGGAVDFCAKRFVARPVQCTMAFASLKLGGPFDLIWCGSLVTHVREADAIAIIDLFERHLRPGGLMVFTTHGREMRARRLAGKPSYHLTDEQFALMDAAYRAGRYAFAPYSHRTDYGISMTPLGWIAERIAARPELSLVALMESAWDKHQDAVAVARR